jgi:hypothetical protein
MIADSHVRQLVLIIDQAYDRPSWHGTNLRGSIRRLSLAEASWRPAPHRHNIWEIVVHAAYWKYAVWRRLVGERRGSFPLKGSNWFRRPEMRSEAAWRADVALLDQMHASLRQAIGSLTGRALHNRGASQMSNFAVISGIAAHDLYHAGQIQLLKKMLRSDVTSRTRARRSRRAIHPASGR